MDMSWPDRRWTEGEEPDHPALEGDEPDHPALEGDEPDHPALEGDEPDGRAARLAELHATSARLRSRGRRARRSALVASSWYLEVRSRRCIPYATWADDSVRRVTHAVLAGDPLTGDPPDAATLDAALADLGAARARAGFDEQDLVDELDALTAVAPLPLVSADLLDATLAGWREAAERAETPSPSPDTEGAPTHIDLPAEERAELDRELAALLAAASDDETTRRLVVVDVDHGTAPDHDRVVAALERLSATRFPDRRWLTLAPSHRYGFVVHDGRRAAHALATLRADVRTAPELSGARVWIWMEELPRDPASVASFVRGLAMAAPGTTAAHTEEPERSPAATRHPPRGIRRGSTRTRRRRAPAFEHLTGAMGLALVTVLVAGSLGMPSDEPTPSEVTLPDRSRPPATPAPDATAEPPPDAAPRPAPSPTRDAPERDAAPAPSEPGDDEVVLDEPQPIVETSPAPEPNPGSDEPAPEEPATEEPATEEPATEEPPIEDGDRNSPDAPSSTEPRPGTTDTPPGHAHAPGTDTPGPPDHATPGSPGDTGGAGGPNGSGGPASSPATSGPDVGTGPPLHAATGPPS